MQILGVGVATLDIIDSLAEFPREDSEQRALARWSRVGGNAANTLMVLSQYGHRCSWAGTLAGDTDAANIEDWLKAHAIDLRWAQRYPDGVSPVSHILHSRRTASRTIVHYRDLPEFEAEAFAGIELGPFDWLHFEGRHVPACEQMLRLARQRRPDLHCSLEVEKPRAEIERLFPLADVLFFSRAYAEAVGYASAEALLTAIRARGVKGLLYVTWGEAGAWLDDGRNPLQHCPAFRPSELIDTLGAGDVFNAGLIHGLVQGQSPQQALERAVELAGRKCGQQGLEGLVTDDV
ncbi:MAG: PfkB family carbohydrate kinase [Candidatus Thiodiazotropha sp.]